MLNTTKALSVPLNSIRSKPDSSVKCLECVSKRKIRKFEWILRQFKEETRRLSSAKSRVDDAEMAQKTPKLRIREFLRHTLRHICVRPHIALLPETCLSAVPHLFAYIMPLGAPRVNPCARFLRAKRASDIHPRLVYCLTIFTYPLFLPMKNSAIVPGPECEPIIMPI